MHAYEMNASNFGSYLGGGTCDGTRLVSAGLELDLAEFASDADTVALYHLHDAAWSDASGHGYTLTGYNGAALGDYGLALDASAAKYARTGSVINLSGATAVTLEAWARWTGGALANGEYRRLLRWETASPAQYINVFLYGQTSGPPKVISQAYLGASPSNSNQNVLLTPAQWSAMTSAEFHIEVNVDLAAARHRIFLNGALLLNVSFAHAAIASAAGQLVLGYASAASTWIGTVDEVRLSTAARHTDAFAPLRRTASGTFTSPAIDSARPGALWAALDSCAAVPGDCSLAFQARAADTLDGPNVDAPWQSAALLEGPGRYAQWQAILTRGSDALALHTPTVASVTATASDLGASLYHGAGDDASCIDYDAPIARFGPAVAAHEVAALACPAVHWFGLRSTDADGRVSRTVTAEVRLELDAAGAAVPPRPAPVESLAAAGAGATCVTLSWLAMPEMGDAPPTVFRIYSNGGSGPVNFAAPLAAVAAVTDRRHYQWTSSALTAGQTLTFAVRAETDAGGVDAAPAEITIAVPASVPRAAGHPSATPVLRE